MISRQTKEKPLETLWMVLFGLIILHALMPIIGRIISATLTTYFLLGVELLIMLYFVQWRLRWWVNVTISLILILLIGGLYSVYRTGANPVIVGYGALLSLVPVLIGLRVPTLPQRQTMRLFKIMAWAVVITAITTSIGLVSHPGASRIIATIQSSDDPRLVQFEWLNIGGFSFTYMLVTIYPIVIGFMRERYQGFWIKVLVFGLFATYFMMAEYMTALMAFVLISVLWVTPKHLSHKKLFLMLGIGWVLFMVFQSYIAGLLYDSAGSSTSDILQKRFLYMADGLSGVKNTSDVGGRERVLEMSYQGILHSPIWGNWETGRWVGGHSYIMDFISLFGLVGMCLIYTSYRVLYKQFFLRFKQTPYFTYGLVSFLTAIILSIVNTGNHWIELALFVPLTMKALTVYHERRQANLRK